MAKTAHFGAYFMRPFPIAVAFCLSMSGAEFSQQVPIATDDPWSEAIASGNPEVVAAFTAADAASATLQKQGQAL